MITTVDAGRTYIIEASDPRHIEEELNAAERAAFLYARQDGQSGILVTRHDYTKFTVTVSAKVPYGETWEEDGGTSRGRILELKEINGDEQFCGLIYHIQIT